MRVSEICFECTFFKLSGSCLSVHVAAACCAVCMHVYDAVCIGPLQVQCDVTQRASRRTFLTTYFAKIRVKVTLNQAMSRLEEFKYQEIWAKAPNSII